ncbi:PrgI family protein [Actinobaculum suis]|uniref:PrgI family protein n=1 Tax=Actinobaculum suis TaxID=1657 RepID=A0A7Z8Y7T3_9ACTO|nr:PrgI family protein [Actinobaculum suis]VDG75779.1 PrgI family protein [Actinobaculum suis]
MALEVRVFKEFTSYQAKVVAGMSWRQLLVVAVALPVLAGAYWVSFKLGSDDVGVIIVALLAIPAGALGWVRPMGIPFEQYVGFWWAHRQNRSPLVYCEIGGHDDITSRGKEKPPVGRSRKAIAAFERGN